MYKMFASLQDLASKLEGSVGVQSITTNYVSERLNSKYPQSSIQDQKQ